MRKLLTILVLLLVPATSLRVTCSDIPPEVPVRAASSAPSADSAGEHCRRICERLAAPTSGLFCALTSEATVTVEMALLAAPLAQTSLDVDAAAEPSGFAHAERCLALVRPPQSPPPKAQIL